MWLVMLVTLQHIFQCIGPISCRVTHSKSTSLLQIAYSVYTSTVQSQVALNRCYTCGTWLQTVETAVRTARTQLGFGLQNRRIRSFLSSFLSANLISSLILVVLSMRVINR